MFMDLVLIAFLHFPFLHFPTQLSHLVLKLYTHTHTRSQPTQQQGPDIKASRPSPCDAARLSCPDRISQLSAAARAPASLKEGQADKKCQRKERERDSPGTCQSSLCLCVCVCRNQRIIP